MPSSSDSSVIYSWTHPSFGFVLARPGAAISEDAALPPLSLVEKPGVPRGRPPSSRRQSENSSTSSNINSLAAGGTADPGVPEKPRYGYGGGTGGLSKRHHVRKPLPRGAFVVLEAGDIRLCDDYSHVCTENAAAHRKTRRTLKASRYNLSGLTLFPPASMGIPLLSSNSAGRAPATLTIQSSCTLLCVWS